MHGHGANAVLNAGDLAGLLATSYVRVKSAAQAKDIVLESGLSWASNHRLTFDARRSVTINRLLTVAGTGGLTLTTNDGGSGGELSFGKSGSVKFWDLSSSLIINGANYTLINNIGTLASDIAADPSGHYALANNYDAKADGTSAISDPSQGAGNVPNDPGITGLTDAQIKSGLPAGFDPSIWAEDPNVNGGYPYLIANPPPQ